MYKRYVSVYSLKFFVRKKRNPRSFYNNKEEPYNTGVINNRLRVSLVLLYVEVLVISSISTFLVIVTY